MTRSTNKDTEVASPAPGRRSLRIRPPDESKKSASPKGRKSVGKKKEDDSAAKNGSKLKEPSALPNAVAIQELDKDGIHDTNGESSNTKLTSTKIVRGGRKRHASETETEEGNIAEVKETEENGQAESSGLAKSKKKRKPPVKKKKEDTTADEAEMWTPLEPLEGDEKRESLKKPQSKNDRRKQALVERQAAAEVMLQKPIPRRRANSDSSECLVLHSVSRFDGAPKTIETVDIDDEVSETGSIQIVAEPNVDTAFDFKRLLIQYRSVNLPSALWGVHKDPTDQFVSFTRFNPDYLDNNDIMVDRVIVFKGTLHPEVFINNKQIQLPEMFNVVETLFEAAQVVQFANNTVAPLDSNQVHQEAQ